MSQANSLARKRRAGITQELPPSFPNSNSPQNANAKQVGLTLPQVVAVIDSRLILLETFMRDTKSKTSTQSQPHIESNMPVIPESDNEFISEVNHRFEFLMNELVDLKDVVMKLQSYTMDVNKTLLEERIHLLSDIGPSLVTESNDSRVSSSASSNNTNELGTESSSCV
jgi:hypothetical protein